MKAVVMITTVRKTSPIGIRGMTRPASNAAQSSIHEGRKMFPGPGSRCILVSGRALGGRFMRILELSCWCVTGAGLVMIAIFALH